MFLLYVLSRLSTDILLENPSYAMVPLSSIVLEGVLQVDFFVIVSQVAWRTVIWGVGLQFCLGLFIIRTEPGLLAFEWLGKQVQVS